MTQIPANQQLIAPTANNLAASSQPAAAANANPANTLVGNASRPVNSANSSFARPSTSSQPATLDGVQMEDFLKLLISELQNQDPLNPMDNSQLLDQISQIREIGATNQLTETLQAVVHGQNLTTASTMIGKSVSALTETGEEIEGVVSRVSLENTEDDARVVRLHIGDTSAPLRNVREILEISST